MIALDVSQVVTSVRLDLIACVNGLEYVAQRREGVGMTGEQAIAEGEKLAASGLSPVTVVLENGGILIIPGDCPRHFRFEVFSK